MIDPLLLLTFIPAALALNLTPGADMMFCLGIGIRQGPKAAMWANLGIAAGGMINVVIAGLGLGALFAAYPALFDVIRWLGVGYLLWLAWKMLREPITSDKEEIRGQKAFRDALIVNLTNPKVILFILAFLPQFIDVSRPVLPQFILLGLVLSLGGLLINGLVGLFAGGIGAKLARSRRLEWGLRIVSASVFGALALRLALSKRG